MIYKGVVIEESLQDASVLGDVAIIETKVEPVAAKHKTPWLKQWTLHTVEIAEEKAKAVAQKLSKALDKDHDWYTDFRNKTHHYIIFRDRIFYIDRTIQKQYDEAKEYGISLGIPEYQVDFHPDMAKWER